jgi:hypothetical protein
VVDGVVVAGVVNGTVVAAALVNGAAVVVKTHDVPPAPTVNPGWHCSHLVLSARHPAQFGTAQGWQASGAEPVGGFNPFPSTQV